MIQVLIIEDEKAALRELVALLAHFKEVYICATLCSVKEGRAYLQEHREIDLILSDIQLGDGLSFDIFKKSETNIPIIFVTAHDSYYTEALRNNGIDYLLKPISLKSLQQAITKFKNLKNFFSNTAQIQSVHRYLARRDARFVVRKGMEFVALEAADIVLFQTNNKVVYVVSASGKKFICDKNLSEIESEMDTSVFFRANRQFIVNINFIKSYRVQDKSKIFLHLDPVTDLKILVSQDRAPAFKKWITGEFV